MVSRRINTLAEENARKFEALCNLVDFGQGSFTLGLVKYDVKTDLDRIVEKLKERFSELNIVVAELTPESTIKGSNVLEDIIAYNSQKPDVLIVTGYETLLVPNSNEQQVTLKDAIQPLNFGRNIFAQSCPYPVLICLPFQAMSILLRFAPDLTSWKSGFFEFISFENPSISTNSEGIASSTNVSVSVQQVNIDRDINRARDISSSVLIREFIKSLPESFLHKIEKYERSKAR
jgi:hypothetical protein